ncbi:MAG: family 16 glycosylhydrolase [Gammaproteobacteria bacterium]
MSSQPIPRLARFAALALILTGLAGCFGDGDGPERIPGTPQPMVTGLLIDAPISGVAYRTSGGDEGTTSAAGEFLYIEGESIAFTIGGIELGSVPGAPIITPVGLTRSSDPNDTSAVNQLVFLQSLDSDGDPSNGITIATSVASSADGRSLDFASPTFRDDAMALLGQIAPGAMLISNDEALSNFYATYAEMGGIDTFGFAFAGFPPVGGDTGFELIFSDEFNTDGAPDASKWNFETGYGSNNSGWGNNEWQLYTTATDNVRVEDGNLVIQARCDTPPCGVRDGTVTSARLNTKDKFEFKFGKVIARIKPPVGEGSWPAFWSLGANFPETPWPRAGEIDFMEMFPTVSNDRTTHFTMHWCDQTIQAPETCSFPEGRVFDSQSREFPQALGDDFHIFEADWNGTQITGKMDGVDVFSRNIEAATMEEFLREFFLILNVAMGGTLGSDNQPPSGDEVWPQTMLVDYVRVFQRTGDGVIDDTTIDFEDAPESYDFGMDGGFGGGAAQVLANPVSEGINTSAQVGRMLKFAGEPFAGSSLTLPTPLEIPGGGTFTMKVWSPRAVNVLLKLEGGTTEPEINIPHGGTGWEELSFSFDNFSGSFSALTFIFDLGIVGDATNDPDNWTFYFDDIVVPTGNGGGPDPDPEEPEAFFSDFEDAPESYDFGLDGGFGGGAAQVLANPVPGGINTSAQVGRMLKFAGEPFAGSLLTLPAPIDVVAGSSFNMKVWSPRPVRVLFKLEGDTDAEVEVNHGGTGWELLNFSFPNYASTVQGITLIFDLGTIGDATGDPDNWTFYFDDIEQVPPQPVMPPSLAQIDLPITFDDPMVDYTVVDFGGAVTTLVVDPEDGDNMVASTLKPAGAETFAGTTASTVDGLATAIPFSPTQTTIGIRVYSPDAGIPVRMKVEDADDGDIAVEAELLTTVANEWETLVFDFTNVVTGPALDLSQSYRKINVFFNFNTDGDTAGAKTYLWDDVEFGVPAPVVDDTPPTLTAVSIVSDNANPLLATTGNTLTLSFTADEPIETPTVMIGGMAAAVSGAATTWEATRVIDSGDADGAVAVSIAFADLADNVGTTVTATTDNSSVTVDATAPTATLSGAPVDFTSLDAIALTLTFSEAVSGLELADIVVTNGAASALMAVDATTYTVNVTPSGAGDLMVAVADGAAVDAAGNVSSAATMISVTNNLDADAPLLTAIAIASNNANPALAVTGDVVTLTMTANEDIVAPTVVIGGAPADLITGAGATWTATRTLLATDTEGPVAFLITFEDLGGNIGQAASVTTDGSAVEFDISAPAAQITGLPATIQTLDAIAVTVTFDEDVTGFEAGDLAVTNGVAADFTAVDATTYTANVTPDGIGALSITVAADVAFDAAGNGNSAAAVSADLDLQPLWTLTWSDDFDGSALNDANWTARTDADCPAPCAGVQSYTADNIIVAAGALTIEGREEAGSTYSSALIDTRGKLELTHGRIEIDARMPGTLGTLPSLFLLPVDDAYGPWPQSGEIDLANAPDLGIGSNATLEHTLQYGLPVPENTVTTGTSEPANPALSNTLTYALEWEAGEIRWFVDGVHVATQTQDNWYSYGEDADGVYTLGTDAAPFDQNFYLAIGLGIADTAGAGSTFPQSLQIDAVRVYECANAIDPVAGTGCSTGDAGVMPITAPSEPYTESLDVYVDAPATLSFVDEADPGTPVMQALAVAPVETGGATVNTNNTGAIDGTDVVWSLDINAAAGSAGVTVSAMDNGPTTGFFDLTGGETAGEILFRMRVESATAGTDISVGFDGAAGAAGRDALTFTADGQWQQYSVKIADVVTASVGAGTTLDMANLTALFALNVTGGSAVFSLDDIEVVVACRETGTCQATPRIPNVVVTTVYGPQDFESLDIMGADIGDGWRYFINVFEGPSYLFGYGNPAPNGPQISAIATGEGGAEQGLQQFSVYSDYECCPGGGPGGTPSGHQSANGLVETNVFIEARGVGGSSISADDVGDTWTFTFDAKRGNLGGASRAFAFIKVLNPTAGFSTTDVTQVELTASAADWDTYTLELTIGEWIGQVLQFGFQTTAAGFEPSGVFYDNVEVTSIDGP